MVLHLTTCVLCNGYKYGVVKIEYSIFFYKVVVVEIIIYKKKKYCNKKNNIKKKSEIRGKFSTILYFLLATKSIDC